ncbi:MAG: PIN domain protein [Treponema sp.]|nr:PIN domain protein [Treponema sp.]
MRIYLDHCAFNRPFDEQKSINIQLETSAKLYIQNQIKLGKFDLVWSYMSDLENYNNPNIESKKSIQLWEFIAKYKCKSSDNVLVLGSKLKQKGIRTKDSLHVACAVESKCDYFITTDKGLLNKDVELIKILNPIDFIREMEESNED